VNFGMVKAVVLRSSDKEHLEAMVLCTFLILINPGCSQNAKIVPSGFVIADYKKTVASAKNAIPAAVQIEELYGDADHFIIHYGPNFIDKNGANTWNTEVFFGGRYSLTMQVDVVIDYKQHRIVKMLCEPKFKLAETTKVEILTDGRVMAHGGEGKFFSLSEWERLYEKSGDLSAIGFQNKVIEVVNFDRLVTSARRDRVHVSLLDGRSTQNELMVPEK